MNTLELTTTNIAPTGEAIGRTDGLVIFVPHALPNETIEVEIVHQRKNFARAKLVRVLQPSPERIAPVCKHFGACGGCEWQHVPYPSQLQFKTNAVREQLTRAAKLENPTVRDCIASPKPFNYRNHIQLVTSRNGRLGYYAEGTHNVIEIEQCPIADEALNEMIAQHQTTRTNVDLRVGVHTNQRLEIADWRTQPAPNATSFTEKIGAHTYTISAQSFFQVNSHTAKLLVDEVMQALALSGNERVLDLYCGVGLFTVPISQHAREVVGVESVAAAVQDAEFNLIQARNAKVIKADVRMMLDRINPQDKKFDAVVLDPPRAGVDRDALVELADLRVPKLVYVSCDPAMLARDVKFLCANGYQFIYAQPLDMFPQTHHVETVAVLQL